MDSIAPHQQLPPKRILVVEDDLVGAHTIRTVLAMDGHTVEVSRDAEGALAMFEAYPYDLVITDFLLGQVDGLQLAAAIKKHTPTTPIILITAYAEKLHGTMGKVSNVDQVVSKPFSTAQLKEALWKAFPAG